MTIPISRPSVGEEEIRSVTEVIRSGMLVQGKKVGEFERKFSSRVKRKFGVAVSSGTSALQLSLEAAGIGKGDEVITTPFSFIATANAIIHCGARPVFADIEPDTFNIDPGSIEKVVTGKTRAVLVVHLFGNPCDMDRITAICRKRKLLLVEDCAQAVGAEYRGRPVGSFGALSCFSFYPTKNMVTGEGGMILTDDRELESKLRVLRNQGQVGEYEHVAVGYNHRMTDMAAAIGLEQLRKLDKLNKARIRNARELTGLLSGIGWLKTPVPTRGSRHVFNQYTIRITGRERESVISALKGQGIGSKIYYPKPIHMQPAYMGMGFGEGTFPQSEKAAREVLSIPVHPGVGSEGIRKIAGVLKGM
jgi:perosamine synthetase